MSRTRTSHQPANWAPAAVLHLPLRLPLHVHVPCTKWLYQVPEPQPVGGRRDKQVTLVGDSARIGLAWAWIWAEP
ncbi:hypothetical protein M419DRAFT_118049 [Trichoderma reesei RUT C-30]|uniref:Uncharacterized protein n=1 Tax=Hypocrea jecorina (strain ATCC 56765 / BCRC 32924 / NRRL 11460 / Rut C-30) TaxID=1344414 RepID=A0A024SGY4_HYPJR|nr:hypothetical protein M419DRAFT_118049 [Trichoderma reesei RUT C-30]